MRPWTDVQSYYMVLNLCLPMIPVQIHIGKPASKKASMRNKTLGSDSQSAHISMRLSACMELKNPPTFMDTNQSQRKLLNPQQNQTY